MLVILAILVAAFGLPLLLSTAARLTANGHGEFRARVLETIASAVRRDVAVEPQFLWLIAHDESGRRRRSVLQAAKRLDEGLPLSLALSVPLGLSPAATATIESAEGGPRLDAALRSVARHDRETLVFQHGLLMRLAYPAVILAFLGGFVGIGVAPKFQEVFDSMDIHAPGLLAANELTRHLAYAFLTAVALTIASRFRPVRAAIGALRGLRQAAPTIDVGSWLTALAAAVRAGRPIDESMDRTADALGHRRHVSHVRQLAARISEGERLETVWEDLPAGRWLRSRSGMLAGPPDQMAAAIEELSEMAFERANRARDRFLTLLSPALLLICGGAVALVFGQLFMVLDVLRNSVAIV